MFKRFSIRSIDDQLMEQGFRKVTCSQNDTREEEKLCGTIRMMREMFPDYKLEFYVDMVERQDEMYELYMRRTRR